ncbi:MAG: toxin-antitoxin system YwqK family antitoxin [Bacteroidota bacterium]
MKKLLWTLLIALGLGSYSYSSQPLDVNDEQDDPKINQKDEKGRKQGKWIFFGKDKPEKGYPMEGKISEGTYENDRKNGHWIMYYKDGETPKTEGEFVNNRPNGPFVRYHPNGEVKEQGTFNKRRYVDSLMRFNSDGVVIYESSYNESGKESGPVKYYHDNGNPEFVYNAKNGVPSGKATRYWPNGDVKEEIVYAEDGTVEETSGEIERVNPPLETEDPKPKNVKQGPKPEGVEEFEPNEYNKIYNDDKELWMEGDFKDGHLWDGRLYIYDDDGLLLKVEVYKEGAYHSDGQL